MNQEEMIDKQSRERAAGKREAEQSTSRATNKQVDKQQLSGDTLLALDSSPVAVSNMCSFWGRNTRSLDSFMKGHRYLWLWCLGLAAVIQS
jgi:hypothetical protein